MHKIKILKSKKLSSKKGAMISIITYPVLFMLFMLSIGAFVSSINSNQLAKVHYKSLQAEYNAKQGIEYAFIEIKYQSFAGHSFLTHEIASDNSLVNLEDQSQIPETPMLFADTGADMFTEDGEIVYGLNDSSGNPIFRAKVYKKDSEIYSLIKGTYEQKSRLFISKISGASLFDYVTFTPYDTSFGWRTIDAKGGKIHSNGKIIFSPDMNIYNALEFSTPEKIEYYRHPHIYPGEEDTYKKLRAPFYYPQGYGKDNPPATNFEGSYVNIIDGFFAGSRRGLYMYNQGTSQFEYWDSGPLTVGDPGCDGMARGAGCLSGSYKPIKPWRSDDGMNGFIVKESSGNGYLVSWASGAISEGGDFPENKSYRYIYLESDINCDWDTECATSSPIDRNSNFYWAIPYINGYYIPPFYVSNQTYPVDRYLGDSHEEELIVDLTDSDIQKNDWDSFISSIDKIYEPDIDPLSVTGLNGVVKAGERNGGFNITPPDVPIERLTRAAESSGSGMVIRANESNEIEIIINGVNKNVEEDITFSNTNNSTFTVDCGGIDKTLFTQQTFINQESGLPNKVVALDLAALEECGEGWLPANRIVYSEGIGLSIENGEKLPEGGMTWVVQGNFLLKGNYNTDAEWQPSAAIVSNNSYLLSENFNYPEYLPYPLRHSHAPYSHTYDGVTLPENYEYTNGYNWFYRHDPYGEGKGISGWDATKVMPTLAGDGPTTATEYNYNISLIGYYAYEPKFLELWKYPASFGDDSTPPSSEWKEVKATVTGSFIQLEADRFPRVGAYDGINFRECGQDRYADDRKIQYVDVAQTLAFNDSNYTCRSGDPETIGAPYNLLAANPQEIKEYETNFVTGTQRPPGDLVGLYQSLVLELDYPANPPLSSDYFWKYHWAEMFGEDQST